MIEAVIAAGATVVNIPDTTGYTYPEEFGALIGGLMENVSGIEDVIVSVHCHNDLGMATANALAGVKAGARQVECTINGIGERAGNTAHGRGRDGDQACAATSSASDTGIKTHEITRTSRLVSQHHGHHRAAQQGDRGRERVRALERHPPGRRAQGALHLRDHRPGGRRRGRLERSC